MSLNGKDVVVSVCANCGKEGNSDNMNTCNKCKMVKYCNAACKKKHRHKHKKDCEEHVRLAAEHAAKLHDEELFKQPPTKEDCPICFQQLPLLHTGRRYKTCCGKEICSGCVHAPVFDGQGNLVDNDRQNECAFCRTPAPTSDEEAVKREKKRIETGDPIAIYNHGNYYREGTNGFPQDYTKALELWLRAGGLGLAEAFGNIGMVYEFGHGVEVDKNKAKYYTELAAIRGNATARHNLGINEGRAGNMDKALKHHMIAIGSGEVDSLNYIKCLYSAEGHATKEDYTKALHLYQIYLGEIKSVQRDKAAAAHEYYRYY